MSTERDRLEAVAAVLGSYWTKYYLDQDGVSDLVRTAVYMLDELGFKLVEARACGVADTVPTYHTPRWLPLSRLPDGPGLAVYGSAGTYRPAGTAYGQGTPRAEFAGLPRLAACPLLFETAVGGGRSWVYGRDYTLVDGLVSFTADPDVATVWAFEPSVDLGYVRESFGAVVGALEDSSADYTSFVRAAVAQAAGDTAVGLKRLICSAFGSPAAADSGETVEVVEEVDGRTVVVTDLGGYAGRDGVDPPTAGEVVDPGEAIDGAVLFRTFRGPVDGAPDVVRLDAGLSLLGPLTFGPDDQIGGHPDVVAAFAEDAAARQERYDLTLVTAAGQPYPSEPQLIVRELLRYAAVLVTVLRASAAGSSRLAACRPLLPIHAVLLFDLHAEPVVETGLPAAVASAAIGTAANRVIDADGLPGYSVTRLTPTGC